MLKLLALQHRKHPLVKQHQEVKRDGLADAVPTWTSSSSSRRSRVSSFSFNEANLLLVVASEIVKEEEKKRTKL